ncbi:hypothetical protein ACXKU5_000710 [Yersinia enterocolitica]|uniref:hypothetical protein n=1 Tax=Hafnia paralvei TaxID=546367 RepID=UPI00266B9396|nr:hypothetical protein [Hafnia paralvei]EKN3528015.1 hypothetical protein [Yersinia enterocolitica]EKN6347644.1 hypothetical protein [Yersinia enterocolitica]ELI8317236.1 hypothetical protein [Yersinia enterocolitica]ELI8321297.1 hypothetical protein [Yersinia enterocolitica]ELI8404250.1 hypothetical protein [Yersinia enterocolitica]
MGLWSGFSSFCSSVASAVTSTASRVWNGIKETAAKTVSWMAEKAETFVGSVKSVWEKVKPFISNVIRPIVQNAAKLAEKMLPQFPWVGGALKALDKALGLLVEWDKSELAKRIGKAIEWAINKAKQLKDLFLTQEEMDEASEHEQALREARNQMRGEAASAVDLASLITLYAQLSTRIKDVLDNIQINDFEHYLRLRASQKLLKDTELHLTRAQDIDTITDDDLFLIETGNELLKPKPQLSDDATQRLDRVVMARFGKKLIPFVFEEMIMAWGYNLQDMENEWKSLNDGLSKEQVLLRRLQIGQRLGDLQEDEVPMLNDLEARLPVQQAEMEAKRKRTNEMRNYVFAAEGFLQMLEKEPEEFADQEYLMEDSSTVGMIIIDCAQFGKRWEELHTEQQSLIIDFANIFEKASRARASKLVEVAA